MISAFVPASSETGVFGFSVGVRPISFKNPSGRRSDPPRTGMNTMATRNEAASTKISVTGRNFMNSPARSFQNRKGMKAARVVAVEERTGVNIRLDAS